MTDPLETLKAAADQARANAMAAVNKQESWLEANKKPILIGASVVIVLILAWLFLK